MAGTAIVGKQEYINACQNMEISTEYENLSQTMDWHSYRGHKRRPYITASVDHRQYWKQDIYGLEIEQK